ncbi:MAG: tetratricopeptide repeat protein, partial [Thermoanaerobaculia bacterium]
MARKRRSALQAAEKLVSRGRLEAAVKQYRKALEESPNDTGTLNRLGDLYARLNRVSEAVEMFSSAAEHFTKEGFFVKAIAIYKKIIRLDPTLINVYETLADLYYRQGLVNEARAQYQVVADYYRQSNNQSALVTVYEKMVELEPNNPSHRLKLAEFYCAAEKIPEAMEQYQRIATFMLDHGKVEESFKVYVGAFELKPDDLGFLTDVIVQLIDLDRTEIAQRLLNEAIAKNPDAVRVAELVDLPVVEAAERRGTLDAESEPALAQGSDFEPVAEAELSTPEDEAEISEVVELDLDQDAGPASDLLAEATGASSVSEDAAEADAVELVDLADLVSLDSTDAPPELAADVEPESPVGVEMDALAEDDEPEPERVDAKDETGEFEIDLAELEEAAIEAAVAEEPESAIEAAVAEESESAEFEEAAIEAAVAEEPESAELEEAAIEAA